jgi:hypothetical protein
MCMYVCMTDISVKKWAAVFGDNLVSYTKYVTAYSKFVEVCNDVMFAVILVGDYLHKYCEFCRQQLSVCFISRSSTRLLVST